MRVLDFKYLIMKARSPIDHQWYFFVDKCLPFGAAISCAHFQDFSNAVAHIVQIKIQRKIINYLDDFLFVAIMKIWCEQQISVFIEVCDFIKFPVSLEKTFWGETKLTFLGLLFDSNNRLVCVPWEKILRMIELIQQVLNNPKKKTTVHQMQKICGYLNFLGRAITPGRAFTRRLYSITSNKTKKDGTKINLNSHHHVKLSSENILDLKLWLYFLHHLTAYSRLLADFTISQCAEQIRFFTDASKNPKLGCGGWNETEWFMRQWHAEFIIRENPSIAFLELFGVAAGVLLWIKKYQNSQVVINCDNQSVVNMINNSSSTM